MRIPPRAGTKPLVGGEKNIKWSTDKLWGDGWSSGAVSQWGGEKQEQKNAKFFFVQGICLSETTESPRIIIDDNNYTPPDLEIGFLKSEAPL